MASISCFDDLPNEMLVEIFANVSFEDLVHSVQHVCTRWQEASRDTLLWRDRVYSPEYKDSDSKVASVLEQTPKLQTLTIDQHGVRSVVLRTIANHCTELKKLTLNNYQRLSIANLKNLVQNCPNIECFNMPHDVSHILEKVEIIGQFRNLVHLSLGGWANEEHPVQLKPLADGCPALRSIDLKNKTYLSDDLEYFLLKKRDQLHTLSVRWSTVDFKSTIPLLLVCTALKTLHLDSSCDVNIEVSFQALRSLKMVTSLSLLNLENNINNVRSVFQNRIMDQLVELHMNYYYNYTDELGAIIVKNCPRLKALYFRGCYELTDNSVKNFHTLNELQYINLNGTKISDGGMESIRKCKKLKYLSLKSCEGLTEESMKLMTEFINLQVLKLDYCDIKGLPIHLISSHLKNLTLLSINYSRNVDQEALTRLKTDKPDLVVHDHVDLYIEFEEENNDGEPAEDLQPAENEDHDLVRQAVDEAQPIEDEELEILVDAAYLFEQLDECRV